MWSAKHSFLVILTVIIRGKDQWEMVFKRIKPLYWRNTKLWCADLMMIWLKWQREKKNNISIMYLGLQLPAQTNLLFFPLFLTKIHLLWPFKPHPQPFIHVQHTLPQSFVLALFTFVYLLPHVSMLPSFHSCSHSKGTIQRVSEIPHSPLYADWNGTWVTLYYFPCSLFLPFSPPLSLPPSFLFLFFLPSFLFSLLPSSLSFSNLEALNLGARERAKKRAKSFCKIIHSSTRQNLRSY